ncbi:MAG: DUF1684 domain-containing protein [Anaerolineaceae bacterium]|nr:DUF1684 domain-containing protein [Anaerolineaceae bacterium]
MGIVEQTPADYIAEVEAWRRDMEQQIRAPGPGGWLAIVGMYPLNEGKNTIGSAADSDVLLPPNSAPERIGIVDFHDQHGTLHVTTDEVVTVDDVPVRSAQLRNYYEAGGMSVIRIRDIRFGIMQWASDPYNIRVWDANSPKRLNFPGRVWYPINTKYRVTGQFSLYPHIKNMTVDHTGGETQELKNIGFVEFELFGQSFHFEAAASEKGTDYVWLLMRDGTTGKSTYGAGRFMMARLYSDQTVDLDFNKFYHPPCAFCEFTTCPMPPRSNVLPFPIEAGERFP